MRQLFRASLVMAVVLMLMAGVGCSAPSGSGDGAGIETPSPAAGGGAAGSQLAVGLHDMGDGTVQAVGTLEWSDLEGGFWVITVEPSHAAGVTGKTVAVIADGGEFNDELELLKGKQVLAAGTKLEGASIRMAGPEIEMESIQEMAAGGPAE